MNYKKLLPFLFAFVLPLFAVYAWWGGFNAVEIREDVRGPYTYAYLENTGDYSKLPELAAQVRDLLKNKPRGLPITVLYSNPDSVEVNQRVAHTGYLVAADTIVHPPLKLASIPARPVLLAQVRAGHLLAPSRAYVALDRYMQARGSGIRMPTVEIYEPTDTPLRMGQFTLEMDRP